MSIKPPVQAVLTAAGQATPWIYINGCGTLRLDFKGTVGTVVVEAAEDEPDGYSTIQDTYTSSTGRATIVDLTGAYYRARMTAFTSGVGVNARIEGC